MTAYFGYLTFRTGDLLAWSDAQTLGWGRTLQWPWEALYQTAGRVLFASTPDRRFQFAMDLLFAAVIVVAVIVLARRTQWPEVTYLAPSPAEPFVAMTRAIANQFAAFPPYSGQYQDIIPHLTVASGDAASATVAENELAFPFKQAGAVQSTCRAVEWIENSSGMWKIFRVVNLQNFDA